MTCRAQLSGLMYAACTCTFMSEAASVSSSREMQEDDSGMCLGGAQNFSADFAMHHTWTWAVSENGNITEMRNAHGSKAIARRGATVPRARIHGDIGGLVCPTSK